MAFIILSFVYFINSTEINLKLIAHSWSLFSSSISHLPILIQSQQVGLSYWPTANINMDLNLEDKSVTCKWNTPNMRCPYFAQFWGRNAESIKKLKFISKLPC